MATAVFLASYACKNQRRLRLTQAAAALLWVGYGALLHAVPIVVANLLVAAAATYSIRSRPAASTAPSASTQRAINRASAPDLSRIS